MLQVQSLHVFLRDRNIVTIKKENQTELQLLCLTENKQQCTV